jgi:hypothetical protein
MRIYIDEDQAGSILIELLRIADHDVQCPADIGLMKARDPEQLMNAIKEDRVFLTGNHDHFLALHNLILCARGHHPGIMVVRRDNDPHRDMTPRGIVNAIKKLAASAASLCDEFHILNRWR